MAVSTRTVLVVDDEPAIRSLLSLVLETEGYAVDSASDGREAIEKLRHQPPDALVVDLDMPNMNGCDLIRVCRDDVDLHHLPIVAISAVYGDRVARELDIHGFLSKPFPLDVLLNLLQSALH